MPVSLRNSLVVGLLSLLTLAGIGQPESRYGAGVRTEGTVRILLVFAEINYLDPQRNVTNSSNWPQGQLPANAGSMFDVLASGTPTPGTLTDYYDEMSGGNYRVVADYLYNGGQPFVINQLTEQDTLNNHVVMANKAAQAANATSWSTSGSLSQQDFDLWTENGTGFERTSAADNLYDYVFFFIRNFDEVTHSASYGNPYAADLYLHGKANSGFCVFNNLTFDIIKHEFGHVLLGDNLFHAAGGHENPDHDSYFIATQGGWGMMGNAGSSMKTVNAWECRRLDWRGPDKIDQISVGSGLGESNADLDPYNIALEGTYVLRDFVTTGDAMRIKLPFIPGTEFQQWLWIENHQGYSTFDNFNNVSCQVPFQAGLYAYVQCDKEVMSGGQTFHAGYADYIKPLSAFGMHDVSLGDPFSDQCVGGYETFVHDYTMPNPLTGYSDLQQTNYDINLDDHLDLLERTADFVEEDANGVLSNKWFWRGHGRQAFLNGAGGNSRIGMSTNPSSASQMTLVSGDQVYLDPNTNLPLSKNNRTIYLNGVSVEITSYNAGTGEVTVDVQFDQVHLDEDVRWCADDIYLPDMASEYSSLTAAGWSLIVDPGVTLLLDRNRMPTRIDNPETVTINGTSHTLFNSATSFRMEPGAAMTVEESGTLRIDNGSTLTLGLNNELNIVNADVEVLNGSTLILDQSSFLNLSGSGGTVYVDHSSTLIIRENAQIELAGNSSVLHVDGTVIVEQNAQLGFSGNGHFVLAGTVQNDGSAEWPLNGRDKDDLVLVIGSDIVWTGGTVNFNGGRIDYVANDVSIQIKNTNQCDMNGIRFNGHGSSAPWTGVTALDFDDVEASITDCEFLDFETGVLLANGTGTTEIHDSYFDQNIYSINVVESETLEVADCEIISVGNLPSGAISYYNTGIDAANTDQVRVDATSISAAAHGVKLDAVDGYYMRSGSIIGCDYGLTGESSLVFLRNGATIKNTLEYAIGLNAADPLNSMLTIGDLGCGNLHNNDEGMWLFGTTLNIDATIHASNSGTPSFVQHNRLDQNPFEAIDACYHNSAGLFVPPVIFAKGNYWNESGGSGIAPVAGLIEVRYSSTMLPWFCGASSSPITVDHSQFTTCVPQAVCDCFLGSAPVGGGSFDGIANKVFLPAETTLPAREPEAQLASFETYGSSEEALKAIVLENYVVANRAFLQADNAQTRAGFQELAAIGLEKEGQNSWKAKTTGGAELALDNESIHRIVVAKVLTKTPLTGAADDDIFSDYFDWAAKENLKPSAVVFPNPSDGSFTLTLTGFEATYTYAVLTELGAEIDKGTLQSGANKVELASPKAGVYSLLVFSESGQIVAKEKLVVQ